MRTVNAIKYVVSFCLFCGTACTTAGAAGIDLKPTPEKVTEAVLSTGGAQLVFYRNLWQAMRVRTTSGQEVPITDLFFYHTQAKGLSGGYWSDPTNWDTQLTFEIIKHAESAGETLLIEGVRDGLKKQVYATIDPDRPIVYVVNRLTATAAIQDVQDAQLIYFPADPNQLTYPAEIVLDERDDAHVFDTAKEDSGQEYSYVYLPGLDASLAVLCAPMSQQKLKLANPLWYRGKPESREVIVQGIAGQELGPGEVIELRYAIYWNDGARLEEVKALARGLQAGEFDRHFYPVSPQAAARPQVPAKPQPAVALPREVPARPAGTRPPPDARRYATFELIRQPEASEPGFSRSVTEYRAQVSRKKWDQARKLTVTNLAAIEDTLAVIIEVEPRKGASYAVVDESGRAIVTQADDLDGDGAVDEVCFLLTVAAGGQRLVVLLDGEGEGFTAPSDMSVAEHRTGSWLPLRTQPTSSASTTQHSTYISKANLARARQIMDRLESPVAMALLECDDFRLVLGCDSGLIEGMRPASIPAEFVGSFLREFVPVEPVMSAMKHVLGGPVRHRFVWTGESGEQRVVTVYRNGAIDTAWAKAPAELQVLICAYPYRYLQSGDSNVVGYSQVLERRRALPNVDRLSFFGRRDASLGIEATGLQATEHQVWLDAGEIGWNVGLDANEKKSDENPAQRVGRLCADTTIAGGLHVTSWQSEGRQASLMYRIANIGEGSQKAGMGLVRVERTSLSPAVVPTLQAPEPEPPVAVTLKRTAITVNRLHPNRINGWELQPKTLAKHNPQPAYFAVDLKNHTNAPAVIELGLDAADWILEASLLSGRRELTHKHVGPDRVVPHFDREDPLTPGGAPVKIEVPAGASMPIELCIRPQEQTLGRLSCRLRWREAGTGGAADLSVTVRPTILFNPYDAPATEAVSEYSNFTRKGFPIIYDEMFFGGATPESDLWSLTNYRDHERNGFWLEDPIMLNDYYLKQLHPDSSFDPGNFRGLDHLSWAKRVVDRMNDPRFAAYRAGIHLHDEIWEQTGAKGRPTSGVISLDRMITMNVHTPAWASFMEPALDEPFQYHIKMPNDIAEVFYYCGQDKRLQEYTRKLVEPRTDLFEQWKRDPGFMAGAGTDRPRQIMSFWISTQLHVTRYESVRRQAWWLRHHGIDIIKSWAWAGDYSLYAGRIMHWIAMPATIDGKIRYLLTDRGLAWMDMKEDMDLITLVRLLREEVTDEALLQQLDTLAARALDASQLDNFDEARHHYVAALKLLRPDLLYLAPADLYRGPVKAEALPDLRTEDLGFARSQQIQRIVVPLVSETGQRPKPVVDGVLDNSYLERGATVEMREASNGGDPGAATMVYLARDGEYFYVLFVCNEPMMARLRSAITDRDGAVWKEDSVEVYIDKAGDGKQYTQLAVNAIGTVYDARKDLKTAWNLPLNVQTLCGADSWTVELRIPFLALGGAPKPGETWRMNFMRQRTTTTPWELNAWCVTFGGFDNPDRFGVVQFE